MRFVDWGIAEVILIYDVEVGLSNGIRDVDFVRSSKANQ